MATGRQRAATPDDEPMEDEHKNILSTCRKALAKDMEPVRVLRQIVDPVLFTTEDKTKIIGSRLTREQQCEKLLDMLPGKGAKAYDVFKEAISKVHPHLAVIVLRAGKYFQLLKFS